MSPDRLLFQFIYFGGGLAILFSIGQFIRPGLDQRRIFLGLFLAAIGVIQLHAGLMHSRDILYVPHLLFLNVPALYFCGPLLAAYLAAVGQNDSRFRAGQYIQLAPGVIAALSLSTIYALSADEKIVLILAKPRVFYPTLLPVMFKLALGLIVIYAAMGLRTMIYVLRNAEAVAEYRRPLIAFVALFLLSGALGNIGYISGSIFLVRLAYVCLTLMLITLYFFGLRYPDLLFHVAEGIRQQRSDLYRLKGIDLKAIDSRLKRLMETDRVYQDENLGLDDLAVMLRISPEQLSRFLNKQLGKNFSTFINEYRIEESSQLLLKDPKRTVLSIAYAVGFNSSSVFHEAFRRFTGTTPGKFRQNARAPQNA